jgi:hypothetical protein
MNSHLGWDILLAASDGQGGRAMLREMELEYWLRSLSERERERFAREALEFLEIKPGGGYTTFVRDNGDVVEMLVSRRTKLRFDA